MENEYKYRAFISYSHKDERIASWLHKALETYKVPGNIVGEETEFGPVPARIAPIFRDREELPSSTNLGDTLTQALADSACQIVICSPHAAQSHWTNEEILTFKRLGRSNRIFALIVDGEPGASANPDTADQECFPPALIYELDEEGELSTRRSEPIAADARKGKDGKNAAKLKLIAGMLGVGFDALRQRENQRKQRRIVALAAAAIVGMAITSSLAIMAYFARIEAEEQRNRAEIEAETARQTTEFLVGLFEVSDPSESLGNTITVREILDQGADRIEDELGDQPEIQATLMDTMGTAYKGLGLYESAASLVRRALDTRAGIFGRRHPQTLESINHLGELQSLQANYGAAEANLREALKTRREVLGDISPDVADTLADLAYVLTLQGQYPEAEPLIRESLSIRRQLYGEQHEDIARAIEELGLNIFDQGDLDKAAEELRKSVAMQRALRGEKHPDLAAAIGNLALVLADLGEIAEAEELYRAALEMQRSLHPEPHPEVAFALNNVASILALRGELESAEAAYEESLKIRQDLLGATHPKTVNVMFNLASVRNDMGESDGAIEMMREILRLWREAQGNEHPQVATGAITLGVWLGEAGDFSEAEALLDEGILIRRSAFGDNHPRVAIALIAKANLLLASGRVDEALQLAQQAQSSLLENLPEDHWSVAYAGSAVGAALVEQEQYERAESILLSSVEPLKLAPISGAKEKHRIRLAALYDGWGKPEEAAKFKASN